MQLTHQNQRPKIDPTADIAPTATICGDVTIGPHCRVMHGAAIVAEGGRIELGAHCIVFENAVVRSNTNHSTKIGDYCLIGPHAHLVGCTVAEEVFIATGASIFHGARVGKNAEIRINAVVHLKTVLEADAMVPIGWIAVGDPANLFSPDQHEKIWEIQQPLDFPLTVYGFERKDLSMKKITQRLAENLGSHIDDKPIDQVK